MSDTTARWIFMDLDGTIVDHTSHTVPSKTREALRRLHNRGHHLVLATGRPPSLLKNFIEDLGFSTFIAANGRFVSHHGRVLHQDTIPNYIVSHLVDDLHNRGIDVAFLSSKQYAMHEKNSDLPDRFSEIFDIPKPKIIRDFHRHNPILQMVMFYEGKDFDKIAQNYPSLDFNISCDFGIDINRRGGMKEQGMNILVDKLGFSRKNTIAIGDGYNDISLVREAGIGIAMGNACEPLKAVADFVTDSVENDGLFKAFDRLNLI